MCPTLSFLCVRPLRPSREQTAYIWTHFTPPAWPIFWLPLFFLPTSVEVFSLSRPTGSRVTIPSQSLFYGNRIQYTSQLYYKNVWFSSFLKLSFYHLWPCCLRYINSNLEKKKILCSYAARRHIDWNRQCFTALRLIFVSWLFFGTEFSMRLARTRLNHTTMLWGAVRIYHSSSFSSLYKRVDVTQQLVAKVFLIWMRCRNHLLDFFQLFIVLKSFDKIYLVQ